MSNQVDSEISAIDQAYNYLSTIINLYPRDTKFKLLTNDFAPFSNTLKTKEEVTELITEMSLSNTSRNLTDALNRLNLTADNYGSARDTYIVSDFQKSTLGITDDYKDSVNNYYVIPVKYPQTGNVFIDSVYLEDPFLIGDRNNKLSVKLINTGLDDVNDLVVQFFMGDNQIATASVDMLPNSTSEISFDLNVEIDGINKCRLSFQEFPVSFDNDYYFTLNRSERINVLQIKSSEAEGAITNVFANENLFNLTTFDVNNLDYSVINTADLIVLNELETFNSTLLPSFTQFLNRNGHLFIVPSAMPDSISYQSIINSVVLSKSQVNELEQLAPINARNPFFEGMFESQNESFDMPTAMPAIEWRNTPGDLISFKNGAPYLSVFDQLGTMHLAASPFRDAFTSFHRHALFVPILYRIAIQSKQSANRLSYTMDEQLITLQLDSLSKNIIYKLSRDDEEIIPNQRIIGDRLILDLPKYILNSGFYDLTDGNTLVSVLAFNSSKVESRLDQFTESDNIKSVFPQVANLDIFEFSSAADFSQAMKEKYEGVNLWKYALILALAFLLAEVLLLRFL